MTDTVRTVAALQALLADNANAEITPQDLRDMLVSLASPLLALYETGWKDNVMPMHTVGVPVANAPAMTAFGPSGLREEYAFDLNDYAFIPSFHINHDISAGLKAYLHVHWTTNGTQLHAVRWEMQILRALGHNQAAFNTVTTITLEQAASGTAWQHMIAEVPLADALTLVEPDELILVTIKRITNGATDNSNAVFGLCADLHYQSDRQSTLNKAPDFYA